MSYSSDLAKALMTALSDTGDLIVVRAQLEEEVLAALEGPGQGPGRRQEPQRAASRRIKPAMPPEIILVNNLVRQYLESVGLQRTSSVLVTESGLPQQAVPHSVLKSTFPSISCFNDGPLLCSMVQNQLKCEK